MALKFKEHKYELSAFHYVGGSVGSGKTYWAIKMMIEDVRQNFIYVVPTLALSSQIEKRIAEENVDNDKNVVRIDSEHHEGTVAEDALNILYKTGRFSSTILILTTPTFLDILDDFGLIKPLWNVILDEAFNPIDITTVKTEHLEVIFELLDCSDSDNIAPKSKERLDEIFANQSDILITDNNKLTPLFNRVRASSETVELAYPKSMDDIESKAVFTSYINHEALRGFNEVLFMQAQFEETILYRLWLSSDVEFTEHKYFEGKLRDVHVSMGPLVSIGFLFHEDDDTSKYRFQKSYETGENLNGNERNGLVIHELMRQAENNLNNDYLISYNKWVKCNRAELCPNSEKIPPLANGLDDYKHYHKIACLMSTNPEPLLLKWLERKTGMTGKEINNTYRIHSIYQSIGRISIRDNDNQDEKILIVASETDAKYLNELFEGSKWLGQVGDMNKIPTPPRKMMVNKVQDNPDYQGMARYKKVLQRKLSRKRETGEDASGIQDEITILTGRMNVLKSEIKNQE